MIEIFVLVALANRIGKIVEAKGYKSGKYKWITVGLWFGGEIIGLVLGIALTGGDESVLGLVYIVALLGAAAGAVVAFLIANNLVPQPGSPKSAD